MRVGGGEKRKEKINMNVLYIDAMALSTPSRWFEWLPPVFPFFSPPPFLFLVSVENHVGPPPLVYRLMRFLMPTMLKYFF